MTYATQADLVTRFGYEEIKQLSDKEKTGDIDADVVAKALADADDEINGYIAVQYALPLLSVNVPILLTMSSDIARYYMHENRATDEVIDRYEKWLDYLKGIAENKIKLVGADGIVVGEDVATNIARNPAYDASPIVFTDDLLDLY